MNCIIVDDEPLAREGMLLLLQDIPELNVIGCFNGAKKAKEFMANQDVDLIFLDIQMPGITGLEFAESIAEKTLIIFTTAYSQYALKSYEVDAIDYLLTYADFPRSIAYCLNRVAASAKGLPHSISILQQVHQLQALLKTEPLTELSTEQLHQLIDHIQAGIINLHKVIATPAENLSRAQLSA